VCGVLTELSSIGDDAIDFVVAGVGINANTDMNNFPEDLRESVTSLKEQVKKDVPREVFLRALLEELEYYYKALTQHGFNLILEEWKSLTDTLHAYVEVTSFNKKVEGQAIDVDQDGALLIRLEDGSITRVMSGDVRVRVQRR
jgi:BirA family biotin operon repressor/biotin-[acetyl-CoA-carboxylase] ligase